MNKNSVSEQDILDRAILETEEYLGKVKALADGRALGLLNRLSAAARVTLAKLIETEFIIKEARIECPLCRGKGYFSTDIYKNRPCHCKAGELYSSLTKRAEAAERAQVRVGVAVIVRREGSVLMGHRKGSHGAGTWSFPGGHLEVGESVFECASRELREETGIARDPEHCFRKLTYTNDVFTSEDKHYVTLYVETDFNEDTPEPEVMEPNKCVEWRFFGTPPSPLFLPIKNLLKDNFQIWDNAWKSYEQLFQWRDDLTDRWGEDLIALLASLGGISRDFLLPAEHVLAWETFGKLDEKMRWAYAKAYVRETSRWCVKTAQPF